jgi:ppGpp synthetase/RelA/SpoT-type nucleotidyltranferase
LREKITRPSKTYVTPLEEVTDLAGVRVIAYFPDDVDKIIQIIKNEFVIDPANSIDKRKGRDPASFGYSSVHLIVTFSKERLTLPEYSVFKGLKCEVQVRTILQHAWAEIEHDIVYKSSEDIPFELRRRFASLAGLLEVADREFASIKSDEASVVNNIEKSIEERILNIPVNMQSLRVYLEKYHTRFIGSVSLSGLNQLIHIVGIDTIAALHKVFSKDALRSADKTTLRITRDKCPRSVGESLDDCDLRYFIVLANYAHIPIERAFDFVECPALGLGGYGTRKRANHTMEREVVVAKRKKPIHK